MKTPEILTLILGLVILTISVLTTPTDESTQQKIPKEELIIGTWIAKDDPTVKMVFTKDGLQKDYINGSLEATYNWSIIKEQTPSGLTLHYLILTNIQNSNDVYEYRIDALNKERLILVYYTGIGLSRSVYFRQ